MVESASKGMILMYAKEAILKVLNASEVNPGAPLTMLCQVKWLRCLLGDQGLVACAWTERFGAAVW